MSEQWMGLHNPERHRDNGADYTWCAECENHVVANVLADVAWLDDESGCFPADPCRCCLEAEVETLRAQVQAVRDVLGDVSNVYAPSGVSPLVNVSLILEALDGAK